jgi:hypothetical protein
VRITLAIGLLLAISVGAQTITFIPQAPSRIPGLQEYRVSIEAPPGTPLQVRGMQVALEGLHQNIRVMLYTALQEYAKQSNQRSILHYAAIGGEIAGVLTTAAQSADWLRAKEKYLKIGVPLVTGAVAFARSMIERNFEPVSIPADNMQPLIAVPAGGIVDFAVWAVP